MSGVCHVLGLPHTATNREYELCAFTQKVYKLCKMLKAQGFTVIHYGNEGSNPECDEHVQILMKESILPPERFLEYNETGTNFMVFSRHAAEEIVKRLQRHDFILCSWASHKVITDLVTSSVSGEPIIVEAGIGYAAGIFAPFKVFESNAIMHAYYGLDNVIHAKGPEWYTTVIPNAFDIQNYHVVLPQDKENYLLFLGMRHGGIGKGFNVAKQVAEHTGTLLVVAGPDANGPDEPYVKHVGMLRGHEKAVMLAKAKALIAPSLFLEPFCGAQVEAFMSGTPVISSNWGAFTEYNIEGITGFRCNTMADFEHAVQEVDTLNTAKIAGYGLQFGLKAIGPMYKRYLNRVLLTRTGKGWYEPYTT